MTKAEFNSGYVSIQTLDGTKWIKDIQVGDTVRTPTGYRRVTKVIQSLKRELCPVLDIYYITEDENAPKGFREDGLHRITGNSLVVCNGKAKKAFSICKGDLLSLKGDAKGKVIEIMKIPFNNIGDYFYTFEVDKKECYYADNVCVLGSDFDE